MCMTSAPGLLGYGIESFKDGLAISDSYDWPNIVEELPIDQTTLGQLT